MDLKYLKSVGIYILSALISIVLIIYIMYHLLGGFEVETKTLRSELVTRSETLSLNAYIFRKEEILYADSEGDVNYLCSDGEKVGAGTEVADIYLVGSSSVRSQIIALDKRIDILERSDPGENKTVLNTSLIDRQINQLYYIIRSRIDSGDVGYALQKKDELLILLNKRSIIVGSVKGYSDMLNELKAERESLTKRLDNVSETVITDKSGYFYSTVDGYENVFDGDKVEDLTISAFEAMKASGPESGETGGNAIGKVVLDYVWYIACEIDTERLRLFKTGTVYPVMFPYSSDIAIDMTLDRIVTQNDSDYALLIFKTGKVPENFNYLRMQSVEVVRESYTGFSVPISAVRVVDGKQGVYTLSGNVVGFRYIEPLFEENGYFIVKEPSSDDENYSKMLKLNDLIIVKGKNLYDGKIIG
ncbi:MAG: HlyD family efflux transporter periplasmic adaptor subunit [Firmicutes bacterium]|nr:HlyD family efflux transporter periplasmic adaptor subunit [Bacillota bacterium]